MAVGIGHCPYGSRLSEHFSFLLVGDRFSVGDLPQNVPHTFLKRSADCMQRHFKLLPVAIEIFRQLYFQDFAVFVLAGKYRRLKMLLDLPELCLKHSPVSELQNADPLWRCNSDHLSERSFKPRKRKRLFWACVFRIHRGGFLECVLKSAEGAVAVVKRGVCDLASVADVCICAVDPHKSLICLKRHAMICDEPPPDSWRL